MTTHTEKLIQDGLLPCPFCGGDEVAIREMPHGWDCREYAAQCKSCLNINGTSLSEQGAAKAWNTRHNPDDRLANALKVAVEGLSGVRSKAVQWEDWEYLGLIDQALAEIERIAKGEK